MPLTTEELRSFMESISALRQSVDKGWTDQKDECKSYTVAEVKALEAKIEAKMQELAVKQETEAAERRMRFAGAEEDKCQYGESPEVRAYLNVIKKEAGGLTLNKFLRIVSTGAPKYNGDIHPILKKLPKAAADWAGEGHAFGTVLPGSEGIVDEIRKKQNVEDGGFFGATPTTGGYLVFPEFMAEIIPLLRQIGVVRTLARIIPMSTLFMYWPVVATGSTWAWVAEAGLKHSHDFVFDNVHLTNHLMYSIVPVSNQLLADSRPSAEAVIREDFGRGAATTEDIAFIRGTGIATDPITGIINDITVPTIAAMAVFDYDDLIQMWKAVQQALLTKPVRPGTLANADAIAALASVKDTTNNYIWKEPMTQGMDNAIGRLPFIGPVYADENIQTAAGPPATSTLIYGDWNEAMIGDREEMVVVANPWSDTAFYYNLTLFRAERRVGWALRRPTAFVKLTGCLV